MDLTEHQTRKQLIDPLLRAAGWDVVPYRDGSTLTQYTRSAIEEYPTANGPADYALVLDGEILGIVEAKRLTLGPQNVLTQAERYAAGVEGSRFNYNGLRVPFLYSTNGEVIWFHDIRHHLNRSRQVSGFHTPDALGERMDADAGDAISGFFAIPDNPLMRPYQREACDAIGRAIRDRKQVMLLAMATGTGHTIPVSL